MAKCAKDINEQSPWQDLTPGGEIYEGGTARLTMTGEWRANIPVWHEEKCKQCLLCAPRSARMRPFRCVTASARTLILTTARAAASAGRCAPSARSIL